MENWAELEEDYKTGKYFCFARSSATDFEWYLSEESPLLPLLGVEYKLVIKEDIEQLKELGYQYKTQREIELYKSLNMNVIPIEMILER